jgi:UDPglucose--hexose-1-phosphate uridylyltransferase
MGELRFNELRGEQVDYAIHRQDRTFLPSEDHCPLCPTRPGGPETEIPFPSYEIAVFENRFPAFEAPLGAAEVVVYTDDHQGAFSTLTPERAEALMWVWRDRYRELGAREDVVYVLIFENRGVEVGVTLHHPHGQIYGYPFLPPVAAAERAADKRIGHPAGTRAATPVAVDGEPGMAAAPECAPCVLLERELHDGRRVVFENDGVVVYIPYAARWPYEAHVVMREHRPSLLECSAEELSWLAQGLQRLTRGYDALFDRPFPYVMAMHQAPTGDGPGGDSAPTGHVPGGDSAPVVAGRPAASPSNAGRGHLHVEFYPPLRTAEKLKYLAGSEQGGGTFIADTLPEESAQALREAIARGG